MEKIKEVLKNRKKKAEKSVGLYIAALSVSVFYGLVVAFSFWPIFFLIFSATNLLVSGFEYKKIKEIQIIYNKVEEKWQKKLINEEQAIQQLTSTNNQSK